MLSAFIGLVYRACKRVCCFLIEGITGLYRRSDVLARSENGIVVITKDGVAWVDYSHPEAQRKLQKQIDAFASFGASRGIKRYGESIAEGREQDHSSLERH